jgi:hypothetical protein
MAHNVLSKFRSVAVLCIGAVGLVCTSSLAIAGPQDTPLPAPRLAEEPPQVEADLRLALRQIQRLTETDRDQALERLKRLLTQLEKDPVLPPERRQVLIRMVQDRIRITEADRNTKTATAAQRRVQADQARIEQEQVKQLFEGIKRLQKEGKFEAASRQASELARRSPSNPAAVALERQAAVAAGAAAGRDLQAERDRRMVSGYQGVQRSALAPTSDYALPPDWKSKTKDRARADAVPMTARENAIMQALGAPISVSFKDSPFDAAIEYLRTLTGVPIAVDKSVLDAAGVNYETKISVRLPEVSFRTVLRRVLGEVGLTYVVKDEAIQVITPQQARDMVVTRVYPIRDLVTGDWFDVSFGWDDFVAARNAAMLIDLIKHTIEPASWDSAGGPGTIVFDAPRRALVIRQTAELHGVLGYSR